MRPAVGHARDDARRQLVRRASAASPAAARLAVGAEDHRAVLQRGPGRGQRQADVAPDATRRPRGTRHAVGLAAQRLADRRRHHQHRQRRHRRRPASSAVVGRLRLGGLLEDHVRVGAADAERGDAGPARPPGLGHVTRLGQQLAPRPPTSPRAGTARPRAASAAATPCRIASTILITPGDPAAAWVWPMFDLTEPSHSGRPRPVLAVGGQQRLGLDRVAQRGAGAVRLHHVHVGRRTARRWPAPARITRCCDGPFGAVSPLDAPSWLTAQPRTTASTRWPLRRASDSRSSSSSPTPSRPAGAVGGRGERLAAAVGGQPALPARTRRTRAGVAITVTPPASASEHSPARSACAARCSATSEDEHAVSTVTAGPSKPERVGDPAGHDAAGAAGRQVALELRRPAAQLRGVVAGA